MISGAKRALILAGNGAVRKRASRQLKRFVEKTRIGMIITVGYDMVEYHPRLWNECKDMRIVHIDFLPAERRGGAQDVDRTLLPVR